MPLTREERNRALSLQRRLKILRFWDRVGKFFCYPWTFYKERQTQWLRELTDLYNKMQRPSPANDHPYFSKKEGDVAGQYCDTNLGNPIRRVRAFEEIYRALLGTSELVQTAGGRYAKGKPH